MERCQTPLPGCNCAAADLDGDGDIDSDDTRLFTCLLLDISPASCPP